MSIPESKHEKYSYYKPGKRIESPGLVKYSFGNVISRYIKNLNFWIFSFILFGIIIRLVQYFHNRSLWVDEAMLATNVVTRSFSQLLKPLDNEQGAPFGFLAVSKISTLLFGENEFALRLFPLVTGLAAIILFYKLSKEYLRPFGLLVAVGLFSLAEPLYYYASEFKQYSSDVFFTILLFLLFTKLKSKGTSNFNLFIFSLAGAVIVWFSFPSVFVLAGIGIGTLFYYFKKLDWRSFSRVLVVCIIWLVSFAIFYFTTLRTLSHSNYMQTFWKEYFMPFPSISLNYIMWNVNAFYNLFTYFMKNELSGLSALFFILGSIGIYKNNKKAFYILFLPGIITLVVSSFRLYPFNGRLILFLIPSLIIFIAAGLELIKAVTIPNKSIFIISTILILSLPLYYAVWNIHRPIEKEEIKQTLNYLNKNIRSNDIIYLYSGATEAFNFYKNKYDLANYNTINGVDSRENWQGYINDLNQLRGKKSVWILFSHIYTRTNERDLFIAYLNSMGTMKKSYKAVGAEVYLYDL